MLNEANNVMRELGLSDHHLEIEDAHSIIYIDEFIFMPFKNTLLLNLYYYEKLSLKN